MWPAGAGIANAEADIEKNSDQSAHPAQLGFPTLCKEEKMIRLFVGVAVRLLSWLTNSRGWRRLAAARHAGEGPSAGAP